MTRPDRPVLGDTREIPALVEGLGEEEEEVELVLEVVDFLVAVTLML